MLGRVLASIIIAVILLWYYFRKIEEIPGFRWRAEDFKKLISVGFPIMMAGFLHSNFFLVDRLVIANFLTIEKLGYYAFGFYLVSVVKTIKSAVANVLYQRQNHVYGQDGPSKKEDFSLSPNLHLTLLLI